MCNIWKKEGTPPVSTDGVKLTDEQAMARAGLNVVDFVDIGVECTLRQLLEHGFFHADPHPGNLLATKDGDDLYLTYLDFGMCVTRMLLISVMV